MTEDKNPLLEIRNLTKCFSVGSKRSFEKKQLYALDDVSLKIYKGETMGIIGESGCGKTSILIGKVTSSVDYIWNRFGPGYSEIFYCDPENNTPPNRFMSLARWSPADFMNKCNYSNKPISLVELANMILKIYNIKTTCKKDYLLPSGLRDVDGREIMFLAPTYICIDSVAQVNPNGVEDLLQLDKAGEVKEEGELK